MSTDSIFSLAVMFRSAIEACPLSSLPITFEAFPRGSCGDACLLLGAWLEDHGHSGFAYVCGARNGHSHAWLERTGLVVDITADQFGQDMPSVYVGLRSSFYTSFEVDFTAVGHYRAYDEHTCHRLDAAYKCIREVSARRASP